jgi:hypothetical protein
MSLIASTAAVEIRSVDDRQLKIDDSRPMTDNERVIRQGSIIREQVVYLVVDGRLLYPFKQPGDDENN